MFTCCFIMWQNGRMAVRLKFKPPVRGPSDLRASAIARRLASSSGKGPGAAAAGVRWWVAGRRGLPGPGSELHFYCNLFSNPPKLDLLQLSLPQPGHQQLHHCALGLGSFGTSWITCTSLIPWATSCSPKTAKLDCHFSEGRPVPGESPRRSTTPRSF